MRSIFLDLVAISRSSQSADICAKMNTIYSEEVSKAFSGLEQEWELEANQAPLTNTVFMSRVGLRK